VRENNSADTKVSEGVVRRCAKCQSRKPFLATHDEDHSEASCAPAAHGGPQWSRDPPAARGRDPTAGRCLKEAVTLWGARAGAGSCQDLRTHGERSPCQSRFAGRACDPVGDPRWSSLFLKDYALWKGPMLGHFVKSCSLWEGLMLEKFVENCLP